MLKALFKKQFLELFKGYFVNSKTGKVRSKGSSAFYIILFCFIMFCLCTMFFGLAAFFGKSFLGTGLEWLYFTVMGTISILMGTFGSVFNTFASLYLPKDNELLLSMPIPIKTLLIARLLGVYALSLLYGGCVWLPTCVFYFFYSKNPSVISLIYCILLLFIISLFITVITCVLGFFVALLSKKIKNKGIISAIFTVLFIVVYYSIVFRMENIFKMLVKNGAVFGQGIKKWGNLLYQLGNGAVGSSSGFLIFTAVSLILSVICFYALSKTFLSIATFNNGEKKTAVKTVQIKQQSQKSALLKKELKRFTSSSVYMLNTGLGIVFAPIVAIAAAVKYGALQKVILEIGSEFPAIDRIIPVYLSLIICLIIGIDFITTPSVSLEGKSLWIYKSLPVKSSDILDAKLNLHILLNLPTAVISMLILGITFKLSVPLIILSSLLCCVYVMFTGTVGLIIGLKFPNLTWTTETTPIKQSMASLVALLFGFVIPLILGGGYYFLYEKIPADNYLCYAVVILYVAVFYMKKYLHTKGAVQFDEL